MLDLNMPHLTDKGAREMGAEAVQGLARIVPNIVPSQATTLIVVGAIFLLGGSRTALAFYKEMARSGSVRHSVEHFRRSKGPRKGDRGAGHR